MMSCHIMTTRQLSSGMPSQHEADIGGNWSHSHHSISLFKTVSDIILKIQFFDEKFANKCYRKKYIRKYSNTVSAFLRIQPDHYRSSADKFPSADKKFAVLKVGQDVCLLHIVILTSEIISFMHPQSSL